MLETQSFHPLRSGRNHLRVLAAAGGIDDARVDEVLAMVDLTDAAGRKAGGYSLGMRQRLGLAAALLGDPQVLVLDEPANGLDPQGIRWLRDLLRGFAGRGRAVLVSSHLLAEMDQLADDVIVIDRGRLGPAGPGPRADRGERARPGGLADPPRSWRGRSARPGSARSPTATGSPSPGSTPTGWARSRAAPACSCRSCRPRRPPSRTCSSS